MTLAHVIYLLGTLIIIGTMLFRKNVMIPAIVATFFVALAYSASIMQAFQATFQASLVAAVSLFDVFLIIAIMTALLRSLKDLQADEKMIEPFQKWMSNGHISFIVLFLVTYGISLFFWPTPAIPLVGAILIPVAIRSGLPPIGAAMAISIAGQGMALSADYMIQIAPSISAKAANLDVNLVADRAFILSLVTGFSAIVIAYFMLRKHMKQPSEKHLANWDGDVDRSVREEVKWKGKLFALLVPIAFLCIIIYMVAAKVTGIGELEGGDGAAFIGGAALLLLIASTVTNNAKQSLDRVSEHIIAGLVFAFKAMGVVLPIAGFFFLGNDETAAQILGVAEKAPAFLFDIILQAEQYMPSNGFFVAFGILIIGMITGLDGSGFSGLPLTGALAGPIGTTMDMDPATLAAIGQMGAVWVGGGTLIAWSSLVAVAGFAKVPVMELVRKSFIPVIAGLILSTIFAMMFLA